MLSLHFMQTSNETTIDIVSCSITSDVLNGIKIIKFLFMYHDRNGIDLQA